MAELIGENEKSSSKPSRGTTEAEMSCKATLVPQVRDEQL
jgi:hypothetical protein